MDNKHEQFIPELVDEQVTRLLASRQHVSSDEQMLGDLRHMYQADTRSLEQVWRRLGLETERSDHASVGARQRMGTLHSGSAPARRPKTLTIGRNRSMYTSDEHPIARRLSLIAATFFVVLIVGSMLAVLVLIRQGTHTAAPRAHNISQAQPQLAQGIYVANAHGLVRQDPQTRKVVWQRSLETIVRLVSSGNTVYAIQGKTSSTPAAVLAFDARSGQQRWSQPLVDGEVARPVLYKGQLYIGLTVYGGQPNTDTGYVYVFNLSDGSQLARYRFSTGMRTLAVAGDVLYAGTGQDIRALDAASGRQTWQVAITSRAGYPVSFLQVVDGVLYAIINDDSEQSGNTRSYLAAFNISTGAQIWKTSSFAGDGLSSFTIANHVMYFGLLHTAVGKSFTGEVFAYDLQSHKQLWSQQVNGGVQKAPVVSNGMVYVAGDGGNSFPAEMVALNATTGAITWQKYLDSPMTDGFCVSNGVVYVGNYKTSTADKTVDGMYALDVATGKQLWKDTAGGSPGFIIPTA